MKLSRIHVDQHAIRRNAKGASDPVITVKQGKKNTKGFSAEIWDGDRMVARVVYSPNNPLSCGAKVWVETFMDVIVQENAE